MYAVIRTGGKQYHVQKGDKITVEKLTGDAGSEIKMTCMLSGKPVTTKVVTHNRGEKVIIFKKKRRHNYRRKGGHQQHHTVLEVVSVG
ncbi:MAG: 50S ribosomal protein L21 [Rhodospirillales bacterium]|nr:50S ribosomal protein L21 [Alphaproteobacteria bacterium]MCB9987619.1 50S ribosomal protein L21 [Rhodospirillales bacterium]USO07666.1 MAG: 50S ribosomal protein L21 [Rhodospirillales bacterium]